MGGFEQIFGMVIRCNVEGGGFLNRAVDPDGIAAAGVPAAGDIRCPVAHHDRCADFDGVLPAGRMYHARIGLAAAAMVLFGVGAKIDSVYTAAFFSDCCAHVAVDAVQFGQGGKPEADGRLVGDDDDAAAVTA